MIAVGIVMGGTELPAGRVLARSLARFHPDWPVTGVVVRALRPGLMPDDEPFELVAPVELLGHDTAGVLASVPTAAAAALMRPRLAARLFEHGAERVLILSAETEIRG